MILWDFALEVDLTLILCICSAESVRILEALKNGIFRDAQALGTGLPSIPLL